MLKAAEDTIMTAVDLPSFHNEKQIKLLVTNMIQENFVKQQNWCKKNKKEGPISTLLKKKNKYQASKVANSANANANAASADNRRSKNNSNQCLNHGPTGGRGRDRINESGRRRDRERSQDRWPRLWVSLATKIMTNYHYIPDVLLSPQHNAI